MQMAIDHPMGVASQAVVGTGSRADLRSRGLSRSRHAYNWLTTTAEDIALEIVPPRKDALGDRVGKPLQHILEGQTGDNQGGNSDAAVASVRERLPL
jgi:hypothetical protein